jgi:hypothetical protein
MWLTQPDSIVTWMSFHPIREQGLGLEEKEQEEEEERDCEALSH